MHIRITLPTSRRIRTLKGTNTHAAIKLLDRTLERQPDDAQARWVLQVALGTQDDRRFEVTPKAAARTSTTLMVHSSEDRRSDHILNDRFCGWDGHAYAGEDCTTCQVAATVTGTTRRTERSILLTETEPKHQLGQIRGYAPQGYNTLLSAWRTVAHRAPTQRMYNLKGSRLKRSGDDA